MSIKTENVEKHLVFLNVSDNAYLISQVIWVSVVISYWRIRTVWADLFEKWYIPVHLGETFMLKESFYIAAYDSTDAIKHINSTVVLLSA